MLTLVPYSFKHRDTRITHYVDLGERVNIYDGFDRAVVKLESDQLWWIVPSEIYDEEFCEDDGPYETPEDAVFYLKLKYNKTLYGI